MKCIENEGRIERTKEHKLLGNGGASMEEDVRAFPASICPFRADGKDGAWLWAANFPASGVQPI